MSYALGQAKWVPGQIHFQTTRTGRLPSLQPLIEAGLPIAPYIEHGSYATGQPAIMRYGLDPYRGISGLSGCSSCAMGQEDAQEPPQPLLPALKSAGTMVGVGLVAGALGALLGRPLLGGAAGAAAGYLAWRNWG